MNRAVIVSSCLSLALVIGCGSDHTEGLTPAVVAVSPPAAPTVAPPNPARTSLRIDPATSSLGFTGAKVTGSHDGTFTRFTGTIDLDRADLTASGVNVSIEVGSMTIEPARLAAHLLTDDFFDTATFPNATFSSTTVAAGATGNVGDVPATHTITGDLTLHGVTNRISFPAAIEVTDAGVRARSEFTINRRDFGIVYPGMPDDLIHDDVVIRFDVHAAAG